MTYSDNVEFWKAYKELEDNKTKSGTLKDLKKAIGLQLEPNMANGKMNEKSWSLKHGKDQTDNQNKKHKKDRPHCLIAFKKKWNKKKGILAPIRKKPTRFNGWMNCEHNL